METLMENYRDTEDHDNDSSDNTNNNNAATDPIQVPTTTIPTTTTSPATANGGAAELAAIKTPDAGLEPVNGTKDDPSKDDPSIASEDLSSDEISEDNENPQAQKPPEQDDNDSELNKDSPKLAKVLEDDNDNDEEEEEEEPPPKKQKQLSMLAEEPQGGKQEEKSLEELGTPQLSQPTATPAAVNTGSKSSKKSKKKSNNVWTKPTSRKGKKKTKNNNHNAQAEDTVLIQPIPRFPDKNDDSPDMKICLSKVYKAEKVELSEDRLSAGSTKGYRMVRATRGVMEGAWYFEIKVVKLGDTGHTRLGWSTEKGDLQAPVGYEGNSFGYRDIDGSKVHKALREKYGEEGYVEGDVIGFYINLPEGSKYAPKPPHLVWYKGQRCVYAQDPKEDPPKVVPESEISFFKNGVCQGVAFKDLYGGRYYPAASMYTLPNQPNCIVKFNFGPDFDFFPEDFGGRPVPNPMIEVPYHGFDGRIENGNPWPSTRMCPMLKVVKEQDTKPVDSAEIHG